MNHLQSWPRVVHNHRKNWWSNANKVASYYKTFLYDLPQLLQLLWKRNKNGLREKKKAERTCMDKCQQSSVILKDFSIWSALGANYCNCFGKETKMNWGRNKQQKETVGTCHEPTSRLNTQHQQSLKHKKSKSRKPNIYL